MKELSIYIDLTVPHNSRILKDGEETRLYRDPFKGLADFFFYPIVYKVMDEPIPTNDPFAKEVQRIVRESKDEEESYYKLMEVVKKYYPSADCFLATFIPYHLKLICYFD